MRKPSVRNKAGSPVGDNRVLRILEEGNYTRDLVFKGDSLRRSKMEMIRRGDSWTKERVNKKVVTIISDGDGINVTHHDNDEVNGIRLEYYEAFELAIALLEYTKSDPNMPVPAYEVI